TARKGYTLVGGDPLAPGYRYIDLAMKGDAERPGLDNVIADAKAGLFDVVVCDQWSRLSRFEAEDFIADVLRPLKRAGIILDTVNEGGQDWSTLSGLILAVVHQDQAAAEPKKISHRVMRTAAAMMAAGRPPGGRAPFGYRWEHVEVIKGGKKKLVPVRL